MGLGTQSRKKLAQEKLSELKINVPRGQRENTDQKDCSPSTGGGRRGMKGGL